MAIKRTYTVTPINFGKGFKVNYTVDTATKQRDFAYEKDAQKFGEQLQKYGYTQE